MSLGVLIGYTYFSKDQGRLIRYGDAITQENYGVGEIETVISLIDKRYLDKIDRKQMVDAAIHSAFDQLDVYSRYVSPELREGDDASLSTDFVGIGIEMYQRDDSIHITHSVYDGDTRMAGVNEGDIILAVNDKPMIGDSITYDILRQEITSSDSCMLTYLDYQTGDIKAATLANRKIENDDATIHGMLTDDVGIIKIKQFNSRTYEQFMTSLENLDSMSQELNLIIDVRDNPGGFLPQVTRILDQLIFEKDQLILSTIDRDGNENQYFSKAKNFFKIENIAVLVNENSASASEILAGVIQDLDIGIIVGQTTFGKGLVQEQFNLTSGGKLRLTVSSYHLPTGRSIQKWKDVGINYEDCDSLPTDHFKSTKYRRVLSQCSGIVPDVEVADEACKANYLDLTLASIMLHNTDTGNNQNVEKVLAQNNIFNAGGCIDEYRNDLEYMINRRSMADSEAAFLQLSKETIVTETIELLNQPMREVLTAK